MSCAASGRRPRSPGRPSRAFISFHSAACARPANGSGTSTPSNGRGRPGAPCRPREWSGFSPFSIDVKPTARPTSRATSRSRRLRRGSRRRRWRLRSSAWRRSALRPGWRRRRPVPRRRPCGDWKTPAPDVPALGLSTANWAVIALAIVFEKSNHSGVMAGLVPAIHALLTQVVAASRNMHGDQYLTLSESDSRGWPRRARR